MTVTVEVSPTTWELLLSRSTLVWVLLMAHGAGTFTSGVSASETVIASRLSDGVILPVGRAAGDELGAGEAGSVAAPEDAPAEGSAGVSEQAARATADRAAAARAIRARVITSLKRTQQMLPQTWLHSSHPGEIEQCAQFLAAQLTGGADRQLAEPDRTDGCAR